MTFSNRNSNSLAEPPTHVSINLDSNMIDGLTHLEVMLELEGLAADRALELSLLRPVHVVGHVALQLGQVGELLRARLAGLEIWNWDNGALVIARRQCPI